MFKITPFGPEKLVLTHNFENWIPELSGVSGVSIETVEGIIQD